MSKPTSQWQSVGVWLAVIMALVQLINAGRAFADPVGFASYLGIPLQLVTDAGLVKVYGLRALFLGVFVLTLLHTRQLRALAWMAAVAVLMPIGDVWLVTEAGAPTATVMRHVLIGVFLVVTAVLLFRFVRRQPALS